MSRLRPIDRKTAYLLPPSVEDWLPEDHLARFIVEAMEKLNLNDLARAYAGRGSAAYHPEVMLGLLVYGYATGVFSSRKIERATYDSVAFRYLAAGSHPDHDTLATFRRRFLDELAGIFVQVLHHRSTSHRSPRLPHRPGLLQHQFHRAFLLIRRVFVLAQDALDHEA